MKRRRRSTVWRPETIGIGILVLGFFGWAIFKGGVISKVSNYLFPEEVQVEEVVQDPLQSKLDELRPIYITIESLKLRSEPSLKSTVLRKLPLHERVYYTGIISDSTTSINIGRMVTVEPWVKVVMEDGEEGWLYGAGVHFYKTENLNAFISN